MKFTSEETLAMQNPYSKSKYWEMSATRSAMLTMENDAKIVGHIDAARRVDGTATAESVKAAFTKFKVNVDDWAVGTPDFEVMANLFNEDRDPIVVPDTIMYALRTANITPTQVALTMQLERADYDKVNKIIEALGGKWKKGAKAHVFTDVDAEEAVANYLETGKLDPVENFGFFPTPKVLGRILVNAAFLTEDSLVLEPEAGVGGLAELCAEIVPKKNIVCYEIQEKNCIKLREMGFTVEQVDFLTVAPVARFSNIVMNPPFNRSQADIEHVTHALKFLKPGGTLNAIMSAGITFRKNRKTTDFLKLLEQCGGRIVENEPDAFKESGTMARTVRIRMTKPESVETEHFQEVQQPARVPDEEDDMFDLLALRAARAVTAAATQSAFGF